MKKTIITTSLVLTILVLDAPPATAQSKAKAAQEVAGFVLQRFGKEAVKDGVQALARRIESTAVTHGDQAFKAVRLVGPRGLQLIEEAGTHSKQMVQLLATHGEHGAVFVASKPKAMQLFLAHGEEAAAALVKSRGVAEPAIEAFGKPAARAFQSLANPQNARRLGILTSEGGELAKIGRAPEVLGVFEKFGDPALEFVYRHKAIFTSAAVLGVFLANPEPFITGAKDITQVVAENAIKPLAEIPGTMAKEAAGEVARGTNWTIVFTLVVVVLGSLAAIRLWLKPRHVHRSA